MIKLSKIKIFLVAAARPNFMKMAPLYHALKKERWVNPFIVHTGQHYDLNMSDSFFKDLKLPEPHINLGVGSGTHAEQTGKVMIEFEKFVSSEKPDLVVVAGDVNSTMACTLASVKLHVKIAHLEAGLRSFDRTMPEEINRIVTDALANILWTPSPDADENLLREGISLDRIVRVGNIMIDSLEMLRNKIEKAAVYRQMGLNIREYGVVTLHRPQNVDDPSVLNKIIAALSEVSEKIPLVFPVHPRTRKNIADSKLRLNNSRLRLIEPLSYIPFMNLVFNCRFAVTDSGGLQEETTYLGVPCLTLRENTERPITIMQGTNQLCRPQDIEVSVGRILKNGYRQQTVPDLWDGRAAQRVATSIEKFLFGAQGGQA